MATILKFPDRREAMLVTHIESVMAGRPHRVDDATAILNDITFLRATLASWEAMLLSRIARNGFSYSDEDEAARKAKEAAWKLFDRRLG